VRAQGTLGQKKAGGSAAGSGTLSGGRRKASGSGTLKPVAHHASGTGRLKPVAKKGRVSAVRKLSPGSDVACCSAQALGTLLGWAWEDVLALYWRTAAHPDAGATILATLEAAGCPAREWPAGVTPGARLILGVTLPEPHAVAVTPDGRWWSWGEPFNPVGWPDLEIDEAWAVLL
jgi:hypothetical protein